MRNGYPDCAYDGCRGCGVCMRHAAEAQQVNVEHDSLYVRFEQLRRMMTVIAVRAQGKGNERPDIQNVAEDALKLLDILRGQVLK